MRIITLFFLCFLAIFLSGCKTIKPANLSNIEEVEGNTKKVILVKVLRTFKTDENLYLYAEANGVPIIIVAEDRKEGSISTSKHIGNKKYIFVLKRKNLPNLGEICEGLKISHLADHIKCYSTSNLSSEESLVYYVSQSDFEE